MPVHSRARIGTCYSSARTGMPGPKRYRGMRNKFNPNKDPNKPAIYKIRIKGHLSDEWTDWFEGLTVSLEEDGTTLLSGPLADQAALHGLLKKVRDLGMPLLSVCPHEPDSVATNPHQGLRATDREDETDDKS